MGAGAEIDNWLQTGGIVLAASERSARALAARFHERRRAEGRAAWPTPAIHTWAGFVRAAWETRSADARMLLSPVQEQALWTAVLAREAHLVTLLAGPRERLAKLSMRAHELLCGYAPRSLQPVARTAWDRDAAAFSRWLATFDAECEKTRVLSPARIPLELIDSLQQDSAPRPPLLLAGFDRLLPVQQTVLVAWGAWRELAPAAPAREIRFYSAPGEATELAACAAWCASALADNPQTRLLVLTRDIAARRGAIERAFLNAFPTSSAPPFEFSLGIPLSQVPLARATCLLLRWLDGSLLESEIDWLISTALATADTGECIALAAYMRTLRQRGLARPEWTLPAFIAQPCAEQPPAPWKQRLWEARQKLIAAKPRFQSPLDWAALALQLLESLGLPGARLSSAGFQAWQRWRQALEECASLGFDGRPVPWRGFLDNLDSILRETVYAPESSAAPIQIAGPAESAGLRADAIWFLGATEDAWPATGTAHPLLPLYLQRETGMPHASAQADLDLARSIAARVLASAPRVCFSYPLRTSESEARPSRLIAQLAGAPQPMPAELAPLAPPPPCILPFSDASQIPYSLPTVAGGAGVLTAQSQCAFKAFASTRLGAKGWDAAEFGLSAAQRGLLLHEVMHAVWSGPPRGLHSLDDLRALPDREAFVAARVAEVMCAKLPSGARERMPARYLELEAARLTHLVSEWLAYEATRLAFTVEKTEATGVANIGSLALTLRLDRIDRLIDGSLAVIDYKTGDVTPKSWELPRPDDVQLPLYTNFALDGEPGGLLFAKLRAGQSRFVGLLRDANATLFEAPGTRDALFKNHLTGEQLSAWRDAIGQLVRDFLAGRADVNPRAYPETCERCNLHALCRIRESQTALETSENAEADNE